MLNPLESSQEVKKYLKKLLILIERDAVFKFFKTELIDKNRADDIICCIEASFPQEYKKVIERTGGMQFRTRTLWAQVLGAVKNRFLLSTSVYSVRTSEAIQAINSMMRVMDNEMQKIFEQASGMN